ncbi:protein DMP3 [Coffea eugenioides]|uniref:Protein DMP3-like n=1 Tax=Coffea arabica TaxID=13443 RepID=A0ABM4WVZ8_COFAR|nr:protein DMP3 [Coffea eugenioides]
MSLRARSTPSATATSVAATTEDAPDTPKPQPPQRSSSPLSQRALSQALTSTANLANLLPTGTLLAFQLLTPVFTNNGSCDAATRPMTIILLALLAVSCFLASFTDSVKLSDGQVYYGFATFRGMWLFDAQGTIASGSEVGVPDLSKYRLGFIDWVHSVLSVFVFAAVALRDKNVVGCLYPKPDHEVQEVLDIVPIGIGCLCGLLFLVFPTRRHGIGYPVTPGN